MSLNQSFISDFSEIQVYTYRASFRHKITTTTFRIDKFKNAENADRKKLVSFGNLSLPTCKVSSTCDNLLY